jgi:hypothetical protein
MKCSKKFSSSNCRPTAVPRETSAGIVGLPTSELVRLGKKLISEREVTIRLKR